MKDSQTLDRFFKKVSQDHLQTLGNKINLNDDNNKKFFLNSYKKKYCEQKDLHVHIQ